MPHPSRLALHKLSIHARAQDPSHFDDIVRNVQYLTTSTKCFKENNDRFVSDDSGQVYGMTDGTGLPDALCSLKDDPTGPQVHRGFAKRTLRYSRWVQDKLRKNKDWGFEPDEPDKWNSGGIGKLKMLYVGGHSLGGAAALAFAYWVKLTFKDTNPDLKVHVYVFSAPNVGNAAWARDYNAMLGKTTFQHNYGPDVVPHFPPWLWKVGHVVRLEHKEMHRFWPLTSKPAGDSCTDFSPKGMPAKDKSANFPLDYHLDLFRVFVPCARSVSSTLHATSLRTYIPPPVTYTPLGCACTQILSALEGRVRGKGMAQVHYGGPSMAVGKRERGEHEGLGLRGLGVGAMADAFKVVPEVWES